MENKFYVGKIVKAQGIKGEVKVKCGVAVPLAKTLKTLYLNGSPAEVKSFRLSGEFVFVTFSSVTDRNTAETLAGKDVYADFADIVLAKDDYLVKDVVGCEVRLSGGSVVGRVVDVLQNGKSADVFIVQAGGREVMFPFLKDLVVDLNLNEKALTVDEKRFNEVSVYED